MSKRAQKASSKRQTSMVSDKPKRKRKPPVERAQRLATQMVAKLQAMARSTNKWHGEATPSQAAACARIAQNLGVIAQPLDTLSADLSYLRDTGWAPQAGSPGRKPLPAGERVQIREAKFDPVVHGTENSFEVATTTEKYVVVRGIANKNIRIPVLRAWILTAAEIAAGAVKAGGSTDAPASEDGD